MSYEVFVEVDFLTLGHCLCANQSLVLLEEQFMTRWFSLDLCSSEERREAGNISGGGGRRGYSSILHVRIAC